MSLVGRVDARSNKPHHLPLTPGDLEKLAQKARKFKPTEGPIIFHPTNSRKLYRRLSPNQIKEIATRYEAGRTIAALARAYATSRPALHDLLMAEGVRIRRRGMSTEDANKAIELYESGLTMKQITAEIGYSNSVIGRMLHKRGVAVRPRRNQG